MTAKTRKDNTALWVAGVGSVLILAFFAAVTVRDSCLNPSYAQFMGPEACPTK